MSITNTLALKLKELRELNHLSQDEVARRVGLQKSTISMYEHNKRKPDLETLEALADCFNVPLCDLLDGEKSLTDDASRIGYFDAVKAETPKSKMEQKIITALNEEPTLEKLFLRLLDLPPEKRKTVASSMLSLAKEYTKESSQAKENAIKDKSLTMLSQALLEESATAKLVESLLGMPADRRKETVSAMKTYVEVASAKKK